MRSSKEDINIIVASSQSQPASLECCMCGDSGITQELFQCKVCQFRSQHRYCSNLYPKAECYKACNWCLIQKEDSKEKSQNSCNSSASCKDNSEDDSKNKRKGEEYHGSAGTLKGSNSQRNNINNLNKQLQVVLIKNPIKKPKSPENKSPTATATTTTTTRKRIITNARLEEKIRRTKSEEISNRGLITRHVLRNKVRRYKLLDEVSS